MKAPNLNNIENINKIRMSYIKRNYREIKFSKEEISDSDNSSETSSDNSCGSNAVESMKKFDSYKQ